MEFKAKDWVLVRDDETQKWKLDIFSHFVDVGSFPYICVGDRFSECISYEGNESLLGTSDAPAEWNVGDEVEVLCDNDDKWYPGKIIDIDSSRIMRFKVESSAFKEWRGCPLWCAADQLRKPEEKPEGEFKFGDKVEVDFAGNWREAVIIEIDTSSIPYKVATPDGDIHWCTKSRIRRA